MIVEILSDDSAFNKGKIKNFVIKINGEQMIIPAKTKIVDLMVVIPNDVKAKGEVAEPIVMQSNNDTEIQREDLIKVVNLAVGLKDMSGNELVDRHITAGGIYRVLAVSQVTVALPDKPDELTKIVQHYEVIDDKSARPERLIVLPSEVALYKKGRTAPEKPMVMSELYKCGFCNTENALLLDTAKNKYVGKCINPECGKDIEIDRPKKEKVKA